MIERSTRRCDRAMDVFTIAFSDLGEDLAGRRIVGRKSLAGGGLGPFTSD